jgi:hypothetical protein
MELTVFPDSLHAERLFGITIISPERLFVNRYKANFKRNIAQVYTAIFLRFGTCTGTDIIPSSIGGYNVTTIRSNAFKSRSEITSVVFPESL